MDVYGATNIGLALGFVFGLVFFFRGLRLFRKRLVVGDIPTIPIRGVAMGLAQVRGRATGGRSFPSPVSGTACYAFKVKIERWGKRGRTTHRMDQNGAPFYLEDDSGRILVDPRNAEFSLPVNCRHHVGVSLSCAPAALQDAIRPTPSDLSDDPSVEPRTNEQLWEYAGVGYDLDDELRFIEYCIQPGVEYNVLGTCVENSKAVDANDRNLITKGSNGQTFLISSKSANQLEQSMRRLSTLMVWGGAALAVFCAAMFVARHPLL